MSEDSRFRTFLWEHDIDSQRDWPVDKDGGLLDTENLLVISVSGRGVEFCCGGDWQSPQRLLLTPDMRVVGVDGPTAFPDIEVDKGSLNGLEAWLKERE